MRWMDAYGSWLERPGDSFVQSAWRLVWSVTLFVTVFSAVGTVVALWLGF